MQRIGQLAILGELLVGIVLGAIIAYGPFTQFAGLADNEVFGAMTCSWRCSIISELFASSHDMKNEKAPFLK